MFLMMVVVVLAVMVVVLARVVWVVQANWAVQTLVVVNVSVFKKKREIESMKKCSIVRLTSMNIFMVETKTKD